MSQDKTKDEIMAEDKDKEAADASSVDKVKETDPKAKEKIEKAEEEPVAKAGKRSAKAKKEAEEQEAKEKRKASQDEPDKSKPKKPIKPTRSKLERRGKKYQKSAQAVDKNKVYTLEEALELIPKTSATNFDATVEMHVKLNVDPKQADQNIRDSVVLPGGTGKTMAVAVLAEEDQGKKAKQAGAKITNTDEIFTALDKEQIDFDVLIATPDMMPKLSKYARILGPRNLMPNPKSGTVTNNIEKAVRESLGGKVEYRVDATGIVHLAIGKVSFQKDKLVKNARAVAESIKSKKPSSIKGAYTRNVFFTTTMGPSIKVKTSEID